MFFSRNSNFLRETGLKECDWLKGIHGALCLGLDLNVGLSTASPITTTVHLSGFLFSQATRTSTHSISSLIFYTVKLKKNRPLDRCHTIAWIYTVLCCNKGPWLGHNLVLRLPTRIKLVCGCTRNNSNRQSSNSIVWFGNLRYRK